MSNYYEDDDEEVYVNEDEGSDTIILAKLAWEPMPVYEPWTAPDFAQNVANRLRGVTEESFTNEVLLYQNAMNSLPQYDEYEVRKEISAWEFSVPDVHDFDFSSHAEIYALQIQYRTRLTEIHAIVFAHYEMLSSAQKNLKEMAVKLASGAKHDKDAVASFTVSEFSLALSHAKRLLGYLDSILKNIDFVSSQMDKLMREHQALSRINQSFNNEGLSSLYGKDSPSLKKYNNVSATVRTRNGRMK